jgi:hypothetical protein
MRAASRGPVAPVEVSAGDVEHRIGVEIDVAGPEVAKGDLSRMAQEPGRLVVE